MPVLISNENYSEYRILQDNSIRQQKLDSVRGMRNLEYDIDLPMRKLVAMFALLGCEPLWSCCGFDYDGQPMHKTHEYGDTYIMFLDDWRIQSILKILLTGKKIFDLRGDTSEWIICKQHNLIYLRSDFDYEYSRDKYPWSMKHCIHYPELSVSRIKQLEDLLYMYFRDEFVDSVILKDTNRSQKKYTSNWQYPSLEDWAIKKEYIMGNNNS